MACKSTTEGALQPPSQPAAIVEEALVGGCLPRVAVSQHVDVSRSDTLRECLWNCQAEETAVTGPVVVSFVPCIGCAGGEGISGWQLLLCPVWSSREQRSFSFQAALGLLLESDQFLGIRCLKALPLLMTEVDHSSVPFKAAPAPASTVAEALGGLGLLPPQNGHMCLSACTCARVRWTGAEGGCV